MKAEAQGEFQRLLRFMTSKGARFGLALARYRFSEVGRAMQVSAIERGQDGLRRVAMVDLSDAPKSIDIMGEIAAVDAEIVFVVGMESLLLGEEGEAELSPAIARLNQRRDLLPDIWRRGSSFGYPYPRPRHSPSLRGTPTTCCGASLNLMNYPSNHPTWNQSADHRGMKRRHWAMWPTWKNS